MVASIDYIENVIATYGDATAANWRTLGREGNVVFLEPDLVQEVMITGDLHGHPRNFNGIRKIADLDAHPRRHLILQEVCHGGPTYPANGGCMSHRMLEEVAGLKVRYPDRVHFLLGNHELSEMTEYPIQKSKQMLNLLFRLGMQQMYGPAADKVREAMVPFIQSCPLGAWLPGGVLITHSIPEQVDRHGFDRTIFTRRLDSIEYYERTAIFDLVWGRDYREENAAAFARLMEAKLCINGHEPCAEGFCAPNSLQVILDCSGEKACYVMLTPDRRWTQAEVLAQVRPLGQ